MDQKELSDIKASMNDAQQPVVIRSGFEMPTAMRQKITRAVHQHIAEKVDVDYETTPELLLGIELKSKGRKMSWNLAAYLDGLQESAKNLLASHSGAQSGSK